VDDGATGGCICTATVDQLGGLGFVSYDLSDTATYTIEDDTLAVSYGIQVDYSYCVSGDILSIAPTTLGKTGTVTGEIALERR
jgi:hypothetical protein